MAIQPFRPEGSAQVLVFEGNLVRSANAFGTYPLANGEVPSDVVSGTPIGVRFLLADATDPTDTSKTLPRNVYDDSQPAGTAPRTPGYGVVANVTTATDANVSSRTWVHNLYVTVMPQTATDAAFLTGVDSDDAFIVLDNATDSGLGLETGLPVLILPMTFTFTNWVQGQYGAGPNVRIFVELRPSPVR